MAVAEVESLDCWKIAVHLPSQELLPKFPYSLRPRHVVCAAGTPNRVAAVAEGMFWNYMSIGLDAKAAHGFHTLRDSNPYLTAGRLTNQLWYSVFSCTSGTSAAHAAFSSSGSMSNRGSRAAGAARMADTWWCQLLGTAYWSTISV